MRELDRPPPDHIQSPGSGPEGSGPARVPPEVVRAPHRIAIMGPGRAGTALSQALREAGLAVQGPYGRGEGPAATGRNGGGLLDAVLLCVPDGEIQTAAGAVAGTAPLVGHTSGATPLTALAPAAEAGAELFALHPLQTLTGAADADRLAGAACAIAGSTPRAAGAARALAERIGLQPFEIADERRAAYHAAASVASNFLVALQDAAERIASEAGLSPEHAHRALVPLVRATVDNWARLGPEHALTGPVARGDEETVLAQRAAVERGDPALVDLFDALADHTRRVAARRDAGSAAPGRRTVEPAGARS